MKHLVHLSVTSWEDLNVFLFQFEQENLKLVSEMNNLVDEVR